MTDARPKRRVQIPLLKAAALALAERHGETIMVSNRPITEVKLDSLYFWLTPFGTLEYADAVVARVTCSLVAPVGAARAVLGLVMGQLARKRQ